MSNKMDVPMMNSFLCSVSLNFATEAHYPSESSVYQATPGGAGFLSQKVRGDGLDFGPGGLHTCMSPKALAISMF